MLKISPPAEKESKKIDQFTCQNVNFRFKYLKRIEKDRLRIWFYKNRYTFCIAIYTTLKAHRKSISNHN
jgi:hypothetical protein